MNALIKLVDEKKESMWKMKASFLPKNINADAYFQRALFEVQSNEQVKKIADTEEGKLSIYRCLCRALQMGLQIGGQFPHASITARGGVASLGISALGYKFLALSEPAIIKDVEHIAVYEKEADSIIKGDPITGEFEYKKIFTGERGKIVGVWFIITKLDGSKCGKWVHTDDVKKRMECSSAYKSAVSKKESNTPWIAWYDEMFLGAAYRIALSQYSKTKEGTNHRFAMAEDDDEPIKEPETIETRANKQLQKVIDIIPEKTDIIQEDKKNDNVKTSKSNKPANSDEPLFE